MKDLIREIGIDYLLNSQVGEKIQQVMDTIASVQQNLFALYASEDSAQLNLLKIGSVFQIFLIDTLASKKDADGFSQDDWRMIAEKVSKYAILEEDQSYSSFVFSLYADYIEVSCKKMAGLISEESADAILSIALEIRDKTKLLRNGAISEINYVDDCLWLSLEAMIKLLSSYVTIPFDQEKAKLIQAVSQLAFEYGRYVLYAKEQAILSAYIEQQYVLDEQLQKQYESFCAEVNVQAERFGKLINDAFSPDIRNSLMQSVLLARAAGVKEEELLASAEDIDAFFME